mmetsp:Transcript_19968/g.32919  ORF Transcript_19968/g.32919 Transcript_19968/m.32919 type:complete len:220 (-) Transcript_19968:451-1110(-)
MIDTLFWNMFKRSLGYTLSPGDLRIFSYIALCSFASGSMNQRGTIPSRQPIVIPIEVARNCKMRTLRVFNCCKDNFGSFSPRDFAEASIYPPKPSPATSLNMFPKPAAASVEIPSHRPSVVSIISPATSIIALSRKPNPINGTPAKRNNCHSCFLVGSARAVVFFSCILTRFLSQVSSSWFDTMPSLFKSGFPIRFVISSPTDIDISRTIIARRCRLAK